LSINCAFVVSLYKIVKMHGTSVKIIQIQGGSNMTGTDLCVNKPQCAAAVRP